MLRGADDGVPNPADPPQPPPIATTTPDNVVAELDGEDQIGSMDGKESSMFIYLSAVMQQPKGECSAVHKAKPGDVEWLLPMLKEDSYWLRAHEAKCIYKKLSVTFTCETYYTGVRRRARWVATPA